MANNGNLEEITMTWEPLELSPFWDLFDMTWEPMEWTFEPMTWEPLESGDWVIV